MAPGNLPRTLVQHDVLREVGQGPGVRHRWFAYGVLGGLDSSF